MYQILAIPTENIEKFQKNPFKLSNQHLNIPNLSKKSPTTTLLKNK